MTCRRNLAVSGRLTCVYRDWLQNSIHRRFPEQGRVSAFRLATLFPLELNLYCHEVFSEFIEIRL